jgi:endo-1,4-beta-xylanase
MRCLRCFIGLILLLGGNARAQTFSRKLDGSAPSLRAAFEKDFLMGVALDGRLPDIYKASELDLIRTQFAAITPANCMKMVQLQPEEGRFDFPMADDLVRFAAANRLCVCGHCLVWAKDERTPEWFFRDGAKSAGRELLLKRLGTHIQAVAGRYRGRIASWDVVNEALDDGSGYLRPSRWVSDLGEDFIAHAFALAHEADPGAVLVYNDYNIEQPAKRAKLLRLLGDLIKQKVPIGAVGIQGHWEIDSIPYAEIGETITAIRALGLKVMITELDLDVIPRARWWADGGKHREELRHFNPYAAGCPPEILGRQAEQYARLFALFHEHADAIDRVTFWDLHDGRSWLNDFPWRRVNHPLLFDRASEPKPAFRKVIAVSPTGDAQAGSPSRR